MGTQHTADRVKQALDLVGLAATGLGIIAKLTSNTTDDKAVEILSAIRSVIMTITQGAEGKVSVEACQTALAELEDQIVANDASADDRLRTKFDPETSGDD